MRALVLVPTLSFALFTAQLARADEKQVCSDAYQQAQTLRDQHKLVKAREQMRVCGRAECPGFIAKDCGNWLKDIDPRVPSVVLTAKNSAGAEVTDVRVSVDGAPLVTRLDGLAVDVDPGAHTFTFEGADGRTEQKLVVTEGAKAQLIAVVLGGAGGGAAVISAPASTAAPASAPGPGPSPFPTEPVDSGLSFGVRLGYGIAFGSIESNDSLTDYANGQIPFWLDAGYLLNPSLYLGLYFSYGLVSIGSTAGNACTAEGISCSGSDLRVGLDVQYRLFGKERLQPWIGLGALGYENATFSGSTLLGSSSTSASGIEWVNPQAGLDYKILPTLSAGGFIGASIAEFFGVSSSSGSDSSLTGHTLHGWIYIGARASYDLHI
jgi:hypothetical protein